MRTGRTGSKSSRRPWQPMRSRPRRPSPGGTRPRRAPDRAARPASQPLCELAQPWHHPGLEIPQPLLRTWPPTRFNQCLCVPAFQVLNDSSVGTSTKACCCRGPYPLLLLTSAPPLSRAAVTVGEVCSPTRAPSGHTDGSIPTQRNATHRSATQRTPFPLAHCALAGLVPSACPAQLDHHHRPAPQSAPRVNPPSKLLRVLCSTRPLPLAGEVLTES